VQVIASFRSGFKKVLIELFSLVDRARCIPSSKSFAYKRAYFGFVYEMLFKSQVSKFYEKLPKNLLVKKFSAACIKMRNEKKEGKMRVP